MHNFIIFFFHLPVYAETAITNAHCLNRLHKKYGKLVVVPDRSDAINMLLNRTVSSWSGHSTLRGTLTRVGFSLESF